MKYFIMFVLAMCLSACGTLGGTVSGIGADLSKAGEWIRSK